MAYRRLLSIHTSYILADKPGCFVERYGAREGRDNGAWLRHEQLDKGVKRAGL